jgi:hypothetical protein
MKKLRLFLFPWELQTETHNFKFFYSGIWSGRNNSVQRTKEALGAGEVTASQPSLLHDSTTIRGMGRDGRRPDAMK